MTRLCGLMGGASGIGLAAGHAMSVDGGYTSGKWLA